jgi:hypothetical protein
MMLLQQLSSPKPGLSVAFMRCDLIQADRIFLEIDSDLFQSHAADFT